MRFPLIASGLALLLWVGCISGERPAAHARLLEPPKLLLTWGARGTNDGEFHSPIGIAIGPRDEVWVAEFNNDRVQRFTSEGVFLNRFPVLKNPGGIAVDRAGRCYVSSMTQHQVRVYDSAGHQLAQWGSVRTNTPGQFYQPGGITLGPGGNIYVADQGNHRVEWFSPDGKFLGQFGGYGKEPGMFGGAGNRGSRFGGPQFLVFDARGNIYTTESAAGRVQKLDALGHPLLAWGDNSDTPGNFGGRPKTDRTPLPGPIAVGVDAHGRIWVSATNNRVQLFTAEGKYLFTLASEGDQPGQFKLPHGIARDSRGCMYVVDASNQRIQKFAR